MPEWSDQEFLRTVFDQTRVIRTPLRGIIAGYHVLPYVLLGPAEYDRTSKTVEVRGRIRVSPRLVLGGNAPTYGEMFGERDRERGRCFRGHREASCRGKCARVNTIRSFALSRRDRSLPPRDRVKS